MDRNIDLFCFASRSLDNIRRGIEAKKWAVATVSDAAMKTRISKAKRYFLEGSHGLLYCNETHSFTTPFISTSRADPITVVTDIWREHWVLPFSIEPLGDISKQLSGELAKFTWPILQNCGKGGVSAELNITGTTVFTPKRIKESDWNLILQHLGSNR